MMSSDDKPAYKLSLPPFSAGDLNIFEGRHDFYFAHLTFADGFVYGVAVQQGLMEKRGIHSTNKFGEWLHNYAGEEIVPRISKFGRENRMLIVGEKRPRDISLAILDVFGYDPLPETRRWRVEQAIEFFYFPPIWVEKSAVNKDRSVNFSGMKEEVHRAELRKSRIKFSCTRDGLFTFDFTDWEQGAIPVFEAADPFDGSKAERESAQSLRLSVANVFLTCLHATALKSGSLIHRPFILAPSRIRSKIDIDSGSGGGSRTHLGMGEARNPRTYDKQLPPGMSDWRIVDREVLPPVPINVLDESLVLLDEIVCLPIEKGLQRVKLYGLASSAFCDGNFSISLLQAWPVTESLLFEIWRKHLDDNNGEIEDGVKLLNSKRMEALTGKDMTASMVTNLLFFQKLLPYSVYSRLQKARQARNSLVHGLKPPPKQIVLDLLEATEELMGLVLNLHLKLHHHVGGQGTAVPVD